MPAAIGESGDRFGRFLPTLDQGAQHKRPRALLPHDTSPRRTAAQAIEDQIANRRPVAGAREAVTEPPVLQGFGGGALARLDIG